VDKSKSRAFLSDVLFIVALSTVFFSTVLPLVTFEPLPAKFIYLDIPLLLPKQDFSTFMTRENSLFILRPLISRTTGGKATG